ncbi:MAG: tRNA (adenosine(37)-N6)-dimethylallyltransferase MiaA [bacterium]
MKNIVEKLNTDCSRRVIAIVGPTASGKTGIGVRLAKEFDGEIVSADSRQIYRGLDLGTGKDGTPIGDWQLSNTNSQFPINYQLSIENLRSSIRMFEGIPQWMIDIVEPEAKFNLFDYLPLARIVIEDIFSRGKTPIIVGGTGMYVQALVEGFQLEIQDSENETKNLVAKYSRDQLGQMDKEQLNIILAELDPETHANIDQNNPHRLIRAIERAQSGERAIKVKPDFEVLQIALDLPREELFASIDARVDSRFEEGMLEEVIGLLTSGVSPEWLIGLGLEYREITNYVLSEKQSQPLTQMREDNDFFEMKQQLKYKSHQFARRQLTWFRRFPTIKWASEYREVEKIVKKYLK